MATKLEIFSATYGKAAASASVGSGIFPQTILTVAALESGYGQSGLTKSSNNFGGIKAGKSWTGKTVTMRTREEDGNGNSYYVNAAFRAYPNAEAYFKDYVKLITNDHYTKFGVKTATTPQEQFKRLQSAGYATDNNYANLLTSMYKGVKNWIVENQKITIGFFLLYWY